MPYDNYQADKEARAERLYRQRRECRSELNAASCYVSTCDQCKHQQGECASMDYPYPTTWCSKGHWEGGPQPEAKGEDPWHDCEDFQST